MWRSIVERAGEGLAYTTLIEIDTDITDTRSLAFSDAVYIVLYRSGK